MKQVRLTKSQKRKWSEKQGEGLLLFGQSIQTCFQFGHLFFHIFQIHRECLLNILQQRFIPGQTSEQCLLSCLQFGNDFTKIGRCG